MIEPTEKRPTAPISAAIVADMLSAGDVPPRPTNIESRDLIFFCMCN